MKVWILLAVGLFGQVLGRMALAQCSKDTDCKGDRICVSGVCQAPLGAQGPAKLPVPDASGLPLKWRHGPYATGGALFFEKSEGGRGPAGVLGLGYALEYNALYLFLDAQPIADSSSGIHRMWGGGLGAGWLASLHERIKVGLSGGLGFWKLLACGPTARITEEFGRDYCRAGPDGLNLEVHTYNVLISPFLRIGDSAILTVAPRLLFGSRRESWADHRKGQTSTTVSFGLTLGVGWRFGAN